MKYIDYYKILGISKNASEKEIKKAYRKLARKYHPDVNPGNAEAEKRFKEINEANEVLSHPENRKKYDKYGKDWQHAEQFEQAERQQAQYAGQQASYSGFEEADFSDFFNSMFGGGFQTHQRKFRGRDYHTELQLDLTDTLETHKRTLDINGKKIRITIPAGIADAQVIKIKGHGEHLGNNGENGDLYIKFNIVNNSVFNREKENLFINLNLDLYTAVLGGDVYLNTIDGKKVKLKVKPGTQTDTKVKLKGKGLPRYKKPKEYGDLIVTYKLKIPTDLNTREKELFNELSKLR